MMKLRKRTWLLLLVAFLVVGTVTVYFGGRYLLKRRVLAWRQQGIAASQAGQHAAAADLLVRYLQRRPEDTEALTHYIRSREVTELPNGQHLSETLAALKMLLSLEPDRVDDLRHLLELYVRLDRRPEAIDVANKLLKLEKTMGKASADVRALKLKTQVLMRLRQTQEALETADLWVAAAPNDLGAHMDRLTLRQQMGHPPDTIIADARNLHAARPNDPRFELLLALACETKDASLAAGGAADPNDEAAELLRKAAARPDLTEDVAVALVTAFDRRGMSNDSLQLLSALARSGAGPEMRYRLGRKLWELARWQEAADALAGVNGDDPNVDVTLLAMKTIALASAGHKAEADACRVQLASRDRAAARAWCLILSRVLDGASPDDRKIVSEARSALALDPGNVHLDYYYGDATARSGDLEVAIDAWRRVVRVNPTWTAPAVRLVEGLLQKGRADEALWFASAAARRDPGRPETIIAMARAWAASIDLGGATNSDELLELVTDVQQQIPGEGETLVIRARLLARKGQKDQAREVVRAALASTRPSPPGERLLMTLAALSRKYDLGTQDSCFTLSEKLHGVTPTLAQERAMDQFFGGNAEAGIRMFDELAKRGGGGDDLSWKLARANYLDLSRHPDAKSAWTALADAHGDVLVVQQAALSAEAVRGDWDLQRRAIGRLRKLTGEQALAWRMAEGKLLVESDRKPDNEKGSLLLADLVKEYPGLTGPRILLAQALVRMERIDGAIDHLSAASRLDSASVPIALQLAELLQSRGDFGRAGKELERVAPQLRSADHRSRAARLLAAQGQEDRAIALLESRATEDGTGDDLLLASLYRRRGQLEKTEAIAAMRLERPDLATVQFAALFFAAQGRRADAEHALDKLNGLKLAPGVGAMARGACYWELGDFALATSQFEAATREAPTNPVAWRSLAVCQIATGRTAELAATLERASTSAPKDESLLMLKSESRRLTECAGDDRLRPVVTHLILNPHDTPAGLELLRTVSAGRESGDAEQLAARLHQLAERFPSQVAIRLQLIDCYWQMGRVTDALAVSKKAAIDMPQSAEGAAHVVELCAKASRWAELREVAQTWRTRAPNDLAAADLALARADLGLADYAAAANRLQPYISSARAAADQRADTVMIYAIALLNDGRETIAAELLLPLASQSSRWQIRCSRAAVQIRDARRARAWLDRVASVIPSDAIDSLAVLAESYELVGRPNRRQAPVDADLVARGTRMLRELADRPDAPLLTLLTAAAQAERSADSAAAESYYRRVIAADPAAWIARNNLAVLIVNREGSAKEALELAAAAAKQQPTQPAVLDTLALVQAHGGDFKGAVESMTRAIRIAPDDANLRVQLASYLINAGDLVSAGNALAAVETRRLDLRGLSPRMRDELVVVRKQLREGKAG